MSYPGLTIINKTITLPDGREIQIETGKLAKQADGSAVVKLGNAMILATVVSAKEAKPGVDFMPLSVDYQEKFASNGKIPGGFLKRESRLSDYEILISRLVDRAMRPLFPEDFHADTQVAITLISADADVLPDALACLAAQAAMSVSDIPFNGPVSEVRVISLNGEFIINPKPAQIEKAELELIVAASYDNVIMVEGEMSEVSEELMLNAIKVAHDAIRTQCIVLKELESAAGKTEKRTYSHEVNDWDLKKKINDAVYQQVYEVAKLGNANKNTRAEGFKAVKKAYIESLPADHTEDLTLIGKYYHDVEKDAVRNLILDERKRLDGRSLEQIRPIWSEVGYLPSAHGSAIFTRGETQSLTTVTFGTRLDEQMIDSAMFSGNNKLMLHYNFPGFSTGEVKPNRGPGRREVGHGNLAYRAIKKVMPPEIENPYTIRIVSDILESNGSSSMATVCAGTLALMDAGIKIKAPVSGIAMGLITDTKTGRWAVLSDILGDEDHLGDMDFKVTGTEKGITACQMDIKVDGLSYDILSQALQQANRGRLHILSEMKKTLATPREDLKPHAPRMIMIQIPKELIGAVIGPGGKIIQEIQKTSGATVNIEEKDNAGWVSIFSKDKTALDSALSQIKGIVTLPEVGEVYEGKVKSITAFGAFVEFLPGKDGLLHISEIKWERLDTMEGVLEVGETVKVKLVEVDKKTGKYRLSRKVLIPKPEQQATSNS
ncbi:polyribonucleotide nucleotidyltransferase [Cytophaga hutchinsonii]|uniref:Polyribonucleotide nucleotidyltransferase n=1 Tax=Cytophaga hutchinsonii (strain ATCC 33406 / DSM 1761 / CIP 103989 / NBRC 15051 / NCIMB 9469 / D465) TaxID=269798 RepID=PNP_CYTH3|nr:polyribonucleotide nucleotidyltransferase [Cytophaga hutchinsonii]Q11U61.1 RecName: Full=Polyribonucleotide nucleotidyltransferase; AltName: Full=Polynucleotide phosphorylase; Short=PNPase [Cytophaga hutchinsonii ATCC 33406]ABG59053.1 polyribonucleotide nucleotidyltransferase [Cytophaga hutchinsonii ATCC 33406]SFX38059.1 polyribonucleotide nucleotidyltransferase [Cytophaga hutchinsonii ATCC 33406]